MSYLQYIETTVFGPEDYSSNITDLEVHWVNGTPRIYATTRAGGISVLELGGTLNSIDRAWIGGSTAGEAPRLIPFEIGGREVMGYYGQAASGLLGFEINNNGQLGGSVTVRNADNQNFAAVEVVEVGGQRLIFTADAEAPGITCWEVDSSGRLSEVDTLPLGENQTGTDTTALAQVTVGSKTFLIAADRAGNALSTTEVRSNGTAVAADRLAAPSGTLPIANPTAPVTPCLVQQTATRSPS